MYGKVHSRELVKPTTVLQPFKISKPSEGHKLFGLTKASAPRLSASNKQSSVLSSEERVLQEISNKGVFKARPFNKRLYNQIVSQPREVQEATKPCSF